MQSLYQKFSFISEDVGIDNINNDKILLEEVIKPIVIGSLIKKIFTRVESVDKSITDMLKAADTNILEMKIGKWNLDINDKKL